MPEPNGDLDWEDRVDFWATAVLVPAVAWWIPTLLTAAEATAWASTGAILEIAGLTRAAWSLDGKVAEAKGIPRFAERLRRRLRRAWRRILEAFSRKREHRVVSVGTAHMEAEAMPVIPSTNPTPEPTLEERVERLEEQISRLRSMINGIRTDVGQRFERLEERLQDVKSDLREADRRQEELLERLTVGGFEWELVGLAWFVLGVVAAAWGPSL